MRLLGHIALVAQGEEVRREPGFWERFKKVFSRDSALKRDEAQSLMTTAHLLAGVKRALEGLGITNAVRLVIDGDVLFEDREGRADDVGDLFAAFYENESLYGRGARSLRLTVEHAQHGLVTVMELSATAQANDQTRLELALSSRLEALLEPNPDVAALMATPAQPEAARLQLERFIAKLREALAAAFPKAEVTPARAQTQLVHPQARGSGRTWPDPWDSVHPPTPPANDAALWQAATGWAWHPDYTVVDPIGAPIGPLSAQLGRSKAALELAPFAASDEGAWAEESLGSFAAFDDD